MKNSTNDNIIDKFIKYLSDKGISKLSVKNYKSDLSHFTGWIIFQIRTLGILAEELKDAIPFLSKDISKKYKQYMVSNNTPKKTLNRRLSTLRHLSQFLVSSQILDFDFTQDLSNLSSEKSEDKKAQKIVYEFEEYLKKEKVSKTTIKNYLSDIRQFMSWIEKNANTQTLSK